MERLVDTKEKLNLPQLWGMWRLQSKLHARLTNNDNPADPYLF
jgi:hypothetical protein